MAVPILPPDAELLYSCHLEPERYTLVGSIPDQYNDNISIYIANDGPYSTADVQIVITTKSLPNQTSSFNKAMYIPARNMGKLTNFSNMAGKNVFVKTTGQWTSVYILYIPSDADRPRKISVTPTPVNTNQLIQPMPDSQQSNSLGMGTQLVNLKSQYLALSQEYQTLSQNFATYQTKVAQQFGSLQLKIQALQDQIQALLNTSG